MKLECLTVVFKAMHPVTFDFWKNGSTKDWYGVATWTVALKADTDVQVYHKLSTTLEVIYQVTKTYIMNDK